MTENTMVTRGWYYRNSPIRDDNSIPGLIVRGPTWDTVIVEKLKYSKQKDSFSINDVHKNTMTVDVLWNESEIETCPIENLIVW